MTGKRPIRLACISDLHLGNRRTPTKHIIENLRRAFPNDVNTGELDVLCLVGDVFDSILPLPAEDVTLIQMWIHDLLRLCQRWDIVLIVLEGTPSHDRKQSKEFLRINKMLEKPAECYYQDTLSILHLDKWDIDILNIPDEWRPTPEETWGDVKDIMRQHNLKQVDFILMHGAFDYQLPSHIKLPCHDPKRYLDITRYYISIGHHHVMSRHDRIIAQGSFDRLAHGEEHPKGHIRITVSGPKASSSDVVTFVENKHAMVYNTYSVNSDNVDSVLDTVCRLPMDSHISFVVEKDSDVLTRVSHFIRTHTEYHIKINKQSMQITKDAPIRFVDSNRPVTITAEILPELLKKRLEKQAIDVALQQHALTLLEEVIAN